jgi:hypothetical protein
MVNDANLQSNNDTMCSCLIYRAFLYLNKPNKVSYIIFADNLQTLSEKKED